MPPNKLSREFSPSGKVAYATTNYIAFMEKESVHADFHFLMDFLKNSPISYALTAKPTIYAEIVQEMWRKADCSTRGEIKFTIKGKSYILTPSVINEALHFPNFNFEDTPSTGEIISMLKAINYAANPWFLGRIHKKYLRKEWSYFFDTLSKVFAGKYSSFDSINIFVLRIAYSLLYGKRIDIGRLLLDEFAYKFGPVQNRDHVIYYARFLMIIANYLCKDLSIKDRYDTLPVRMQTKKLFASLVTKNLNSGVEFVLPEHVRVQVFSLYSSPTSSLLLPPTIEDVGEGYTSPTRVALPSSQHSGTVAGTSVSQSGKRKKTTLLSTSKDGNDENETAPEVHASRKKKAVSKVKPASSHFVVDQEMPTAKTRDPVPVPVVKLPLFPEEEKPKHDLLLLLEAAREQDDRQHLMNAASVLKYQLVAHLTSHADGPSTQEMIILANKCYSTLEGLGDNYTSFRIEVNNLIAQHQELEFAAKKREDWNECDIKARYIHQVQSVSEVQQRLSSAQDKLSTAKTYVDSLKIKKEELTAALLKLTEELHEVEERVKTLTAKRDQCKKAHSVAEAELEKLDAEREEARVEFRVANDQYNAAKEEFERMSNHLLQLVRK